MKNYIITSSEYDIINRRLKRLYTRKEKIELALTDTTSKLKETAVSSGFNDDKIGTYIAELNEIEEEIEELEEQAKELKADLDYMDSRLSNINEIKEQVFVMHFIRGMKPKEIAPKIPCGKSSVYRYINEIEQERKEYKNGNMEKH